MISALKKIKSTIGKLSLIDKVYAGLLILAAYFYSRTISQVSFDFNDGHYLYISWRLLQGDIPYRDFLVPHPPVLYILGALLMKIHNSVYFIRYFNLFLFLLSNFLLYRLTFKLFKNKLSALICSVLYFILPISNTVWAGFTQEIVLRFLILLILNILVPTRFLSSNKIYLLVALSLIGLFTKYSIVPFIILLAPFLFLLNRKFFYSYLSYLIISTLIIVILLQIVTNGNFVFDTSTIRKDIPLKPNFKVDSMLYSLIVNYSIFIIFSIMINFFILTKKNKDVIFCTLVPVAYVPFLTILLYRGTFNYVIYPFDVLILLTPSAFISGLFQKSDSLNLKGLFRRMIVKITFFFIILIILFQFQSFIQYISIKSNPKYIAKGIFETDKVNSFINRHSKENDEILSPPYFNYLNRRKMVDNYSETFLHMINYNFGDKHYEVLVNKVAEKITSKSIPIIILHPDLILTEPIRSSTEKSYLQIYKGEIFDLAAYIPLVDREIRKNILSEDSFFGVGFSEQRDQRRAMKSLAEFYFNRGINSNSLRMEIKFDQDLPYPFYLSLVCDGIQLENVAIKKSNIQVLNIDIKRFKNDSLVKCKSEVVGDTITEFLGSKDRYIAKIYKLEIE